MLAGVALTVCMWWYVAAAAADWRKELDDVRSKFPMRYPDRNDVIAPQHAVEVRRWGLEYLFIQPPGKPNPCECSIVNTH